MPFTFICQADSVEQPEGFGEGGLLRERRGGDELFEDGSHVELDVGVLHDKAAVFYER